MRALCTAGLIALGLWMLVGCSNAVDEPQNTQRERSTDELVEQLALIDDRGRFRDVYCGVLEAGGEALPDYRTCESALTRVGAEPEFNGTSLTTGPARNDFLVLFVPGLGWECFAQWLDYEGSGQRHVSDFGYDVRNVDVGGLSSSGENARLLRDYIIALEGADAARPLVLIGYSKGAPDILTALVEYPELQSRVAAVVSIAGSIGGSPLADASRQSQANMLRHFPGATCEKGDEGAIESLRTDVRQQWLAENPLPENIAYFSVVTFPDPDRVSWGLNNAYRALTGVDSRNDTQVLIYDQMMPGSTLLAYVNADHWAVAVPIERSHPIVGSTVINRNDYPREALLEALLRYLDQWLFD